jgi:hypothetical protein
MTRNSWLKSVLVASVVLIALGFSLDASAEKKAQTEPLDLQTGQERVISFSSKVPIGFYGFVTAETFYSDSQLSTFGTNNNTPASYNKTPAGPNRVVDESVEGNNNAFISATAQNSRFGFLLEPYDFGDKPFEVDGRLEMDFFSTGDLSVASLRPRLRRGYAGIGGKGGKWHVLFGQDWDLFSPLNPSTLNLGGNLWRQGNLGFRRPQIRFTSKHSIDDKKGIEAAASLNLPSLSMSFDDAGNTTGVPMFEGRFGYWQELSAGKLLAYVSGAYARHRNQVAGGADVNNWGIAASISAPIHPYFIPAGEFHYGYSLGTMLSNTSDTSRQRMIAGWGQIKSLWLSWLESNVGYGVETLDSGEVAAGWVKRNQVIFANVKFKPVKSFIIGLEYNSLCTDYQGTGKSRANMGLLNVIYTF